MPLSSRLAVDGGEPVRNRPLPYGRQSLDDADIEAVVEALRSDWLTTGPRVDEFEAAFAAYVGVAHAVAVCNGTAALHAAVHALGIGPGDEVVVPTMTFAASANCVVYQGGTPIFADVDAATLLLDAASVEARLTERTRAIIAVDYAGQPCDYTALRALAERHGLALVADAAHAAGAREGDRAVGSLADLSTFSFHPVKHMTTGEGGMITTDDARLAGRLRVFRNHGITSDHRQRATQGAFFYEMVDLGYNYRLTDFQSALGLSQLRRLESFVEARGAIAARYDDAFAEMPEVRPVAVRAGVRHAYHLYPIRLELHLLTAGRDAVMAALRAEGIGVNVHYIPVHLHPYYRERFGTHAGMCPHAERAYEELVTLPLFPAMTDADVADVIAAVRKVIDHYRA